MRAGRPAPPERRGGCAGAAVPKSDCAHLAIRRRPRARASSFGHAPRWMRAGSRQHAGDLTRSALAARTGGAAVAGRPAALGPGDGVTRCLVAGGAVLFARNRRVQDEEIPAFLLRSTGLLNAARDTPDGFRCADASSACCCCPARGGAVPHPPPGRRRISAPDSVAGQGF
jgi:hypothetical protein